MTEDTPTDLDELMRRYAEVCDQDPTMNTKKDIDVVVAYHRKQRARRASGEKPSKDTAGPKIDLSKIISGLKPKPVGPKITRRL